MEHVDQNVEWGCRGEIYDLALEALYYITMTADA